MSAFDNALLELLVVVGLDATGYGKQQFNTICLSNPYLGRSAQLLRIFGIGNCSDDKGGSTRLLGPNLARINAFIRRRGTATRFELRGGSATEQASRGYEIHGVRAPLRTHVHHA